MNDLKYVIACAAILQAFTVTQATAQADVQSPPTKRTYPLLLNERGYQTFLKGEGQPSGPVFSSGTRSKGQVDWKEALQDMGSKVPDDPKLSGSSGLNDPDASAQARKFADDKSVDQRKLMDWRANMNAPAFKKQFDGSLLAEPKKADSSQKVGNRDSERQPEDVRIFGALEVIPGVRATSNWRIKVKNAKTGHTPSDIITGIDGTFSRGLQPGTYFLTPVPPQDLGETITSIVSCETSRDQNFQPAVNLGSIVAMRPACISGVITGLDEQQLKRAIIYTQSRNQTVATKVTFIDPAHGDRGDPPGGAGERRLRTYVPAFGYYLLENVAPGLKDIRVEDRFSRGAPANWSRPDGPERVTLLIKNTLVRSGDMILNWNFDFGDSPARQIRTPGYDARAASTPNASNFPDP